MCHCFARRTSERLFSFGLGDDETISKNNETINNPAIAAPINISDPSPACHLMGTLDATPCPCFAYRQVRVSSYL
jgi:hypothetical protein